jgi:dihydroorotate dehydrogenase
MKNVVVKTRNQAISLFYAHALKPIFFRRDPEDVHDAMMNVGKTLGRFSVTKKISSALFSFADPSLEQNILGITFANPIGLSAGFDKNAILTDILPSVGFGFAELGSVTGEPCAGNPKPRLWRLKESKSLLVYYGLKNDGCEKIAARLRGKKFDMPFGISIANTNDISTIETEAGVADYVKGFHEFKGIGVYDTINISCPSTCGGQPFTDPDRLDALLCAIEKIETTKPIFLKISPDLSREQIDSIIAVCDRHRSHVQGIICSNLTKKRDNDKILDADIPDHGGMSGKIVADLANEQLRYIFERAGDRYVLIGCGGVSSAEDAYEKIKSGASLIHMITGMIYEGPQVVSEINRGLAELLRRDGYKNIAEACGKNLKS